MNKPDKMERVAARLQNRIADLAAAYELRVVLLEDEVDELKVQLKEATGDPEKEEGPAQ